MTKIKIGSFNTWDHNEQISKLEQRSLALASTISEEAFDIIGTQELTNKYQKILKENLTNYNFYGKYRFFNLFFKNIPYNESNNIITNHKVLFHKTFNLPFFPRNINDLKQATNRKSWSLLPRLATIAIIEVNNRQICMINTHLDHRLSSVKKMQLTFIKKIILKYNKKYPIVLTGDFNMQKEDVIFQSFISYLKDIGISRVKIDERTWGNEKNGETLDHIFIPSSWRILKKGVISDESISNISDHRMIYVECNIK